MDCCKQLDVNFLASWDLWHFKSHSHDNIISFCVLFLSRADGLSKLACSPCVGFHSSVDRALQFEHRDHGFESHWNPKKLLCNWLITITTTMVTSSFSKIPLPERIGALLQWINVLDNFAVSFFLMPITIPSLRMRTIHFLLYCVITPHLEKQVAILDLGQVLSFRNLWRYTS